MGSTELAPKVKATYQAVIQLFIEGADLNNLTVAEITAKAGIGKGTAYEYFSNKEEMIAGALFYEMKNSCQSLYEQIRQESNLKEKVDLIFANMEKKLTETNCFFRAIHVMLDNSAVSSKLKEMVKTKTDDELLITDLICRVMEDELGAQVEMTEQEKAYLEMTLLSKIVCYAMYQFGPPNIISLESGALRKMLCRDICRDVENFKSEKSKKA